MANGGHLGNASPSSYVMILNKTEEFINFLRETNRNISDFEFDCYQAAQLFWWEVNETHIQICDFLLDYENDIKLLAPYSSFITCALKILPFVRAEHFPAMRFSGIYDHYNERGNKMRRAVQNLPKALENFYIAIGGLPHVILNDEECENPNKALNLYEKTYKNCLLFVQTPPSGTENALAVFFGYKRFIRSKLRLPLCENDFNDTISVESVYIINSDASSDNQSNASGFDVITTGLLARHVITSGDSVMDSIETAKIAIIVRCIMEQMNLSKPDKDPKDYIKNVGEFHYEPSDLTFEETIEKCEKGLRSPRYPEILLKLLSLLDKNPDIMLHHLVDEYNNFRRLIADSNMVENHETRVCQITNPEINRSPRNNPPPQPQPQPQPQRHRT
ncbi:hypothetical protein ACTXT7_006905 [Hymenolepis weldensis]